MPKNHDPRARKQSATSVYIKIYKKGEEAIPIRMTPKDTLSVSQWNWLLSIILQCGGKLEQAAKESGAAEMRAPLFPIRCLRSQLEASVY